MKKCFFCGFPIAQCGGNHPTEIRRKYLAAMDETRAAQGMEREARKPAGVPVPQDFQARSEGCALNPPSSQGISHE